VREPEVHLERPDHLCDYNADTEHGEFAPWVTLADGSKVIKYCNVTATALTVPTDERVCGVLSSPSVAPRRVKWPSVADVHNSGIECQHSVEAGKVEVPVVVKRRVGGRCQH
jgi:hypothetical protein